jgi:hypothetical protein
MQSLKEAGILTNFIGAILDSLANQGYKPAEASHLTAALLIETVQDVAKKDDGTYDFYVLKPLFRFFISLYQNENKRLVEESYLPKIREKMQKNDQIISFFEEELRTVAQNMEEQK